MDTARALLSEGVTAREAEVLAALGERLTNAEIAARLFVSKRTVESHVSALMRKLRIGSRTELVELALDLGRAPPPPPVRFVEVDGAQVAWSTVGDGPPLLLSAQWTSNIDTLWREQEFTSFVAELSPLASVIQFDKRGCGVSDGPIGGLDDAVEDALAVLDEAGAERCVILAGDFGGFLAIRLASAHHERVAGLVLVNTTACVRWHEGYDVGFHDDELRRRFAELGRVWLSGPEEGPESRDSMVPFAEVSPTYRRSAVRLSEVRRLSIDLAMLDLTGELERIRCPTLVLHRSDDLFLPASHGRYLATTVPGARWRELRGAEQTMWAGDRAVVLSEITDFLATIERG